MGDIITHDVPSMTHIRVTAGASLVEPVYVNDGRHPDNLEMQTVIYSNPNRNSNPNINLNIAGHELET